MLNTTSLLRSLSRHVGCLAREHSPIDSAPTVCFSGFQPHRKLRPMQSLDYFAVAVSGTPVTNRFSEPFLEVDVELRKPRMLRYGENPHQKRRVLHRTRHHPALHCLSQAVARQRNSVTTTSSISIRRAEPAHASSRSRRASSSSTTIRAARPSPAKLVDAFNAAWDGDPLSAFGGIIAFNTARRCRYRVRDSWTRRPSGSSSASSRPTTNRTRSMCSRSGRRTCGC